jgi:hypothetical protein
MDIENNNSSEYFDFLKQDYDHKVRNVNETSLTLMKYILVLFTGTAAIFATRALSIRSGSVLAVASPAFCILASGLVGWAWTVLLKIASLDMLFCYLRITMKTFEPTIPAKEAEPDQTDKAMLSLLEALIGTKIMRLDTQFFMEYLAKAIQKVRWLMFLACLAYAAAILMMALTTMHY